MRRVITGDRDGRSAVSRVEEVAPISAPLFGGLVFHNIWGDDGVPVLPSAGGEPAHTTYFPPRGGYRVISLEFPGVVDGEPAADLDLEQAIREADAVLPGLWGVHDAEGWHATDTIDILMVVKGEITLGLEEGEQVLRAGDWYVQNGTMHQWRMTTPEPCHLVGVLIGADRR